MMHHNHHDKYDYSDITYSSSAPSSSSASPKRSLLYYVDSPSSRSESNNDAASPVYSPPPPPPPPPPHSPASSSSYRTSSAATATTTSTSSRPFHLLGRSRINKAAHATARSAAYYCYAIREENDDDEEDEEGNVVRRHYNYDHYGYDDHKNGRPRHCQSFCMAVLGFAALFGVFCFLLWGAAQPFKPDIIVKSFTTHNLDLGVGTDHTGVPTRLLTLNFSIDISVHNPATFFGIQLRSNSLRLMYSRITIATGQIRKYYQPRKSRRMMKVKVEGHQVPLYGVGESVARSERQGRIPVKLVFNLLSTGNVIGKLLRVQHQKHISCSFFIANSNSNKPIKLQHGSCIYKVS